MNEITKQIIKIEESNISHYQYNEVVEILSDLEFYYKDSIPIDEVIKFIKWRENLSEIELKYGSIKRHLEVFKNEKNER